MCAFLITQQKQQLNAMGDILSHIESCDLLAEIDPVYYNQQKEQYILQYAVQLSQLAQTVFKKGVPAANAKLIGTLIQQ